MDQLRFTIPEMLSLIGVFQCVYIIVYILFRVGNFSRVILPLLYFFVLGLAFFMDFGRYYIGELSLYYDMACWALWAYGPPLSVLLVIQMSQISKLPSFAEWGVLFLVPLAFAVGAALAVVRDKCSSLSACPELMEWLNVTGLVAGAASLLMIWGHRGLLTDIRKQKAGQERYWLILALVSMNIFLLSAVVLRFGGADGFEGNAVLIRTVLGLSFIYLVTTSLFRIYPQALALSSGKKNDQLTPDEMHLAQKIEKLLALDKIYHETTYSRSDLAQEVGASEAATSRVINLYFGKSFPQLLNEYRVEDAKRLLLDTDASVKILAQEVGFNSLPSFNRVFKDITGQSPSEYRKNTIK